MKELDTLNKFYEITTLYKLNLEEAQELLSMIKMIFYHEEFQKRMTNSFLHHAEVTLGYHILQTTVITYIICKKELKKGKKIDINLAVNIAMMHDLYTMQWGKKKDGKTNSFSNLHGFRHPIESVVNSLNWYPEIFKNNKNSYYLIDGIIHHMYPLPVVRMDNEIYNDLELKNFCLLKNIDNYFVNQIFKSCCRGKFGKYSFTLPCSIEGRIVLKADKRVSIDNYNFIKKLK